MGENSFMGRPRPLLGCALSQEPRVACLVSTSSDTVTSPPPALTVPKAPWGPLMPPPTSLTCTCSPVARGQHVRGC